MERGCVPSVVSWVLVWEKGALADPCTLSYRPCRTTALPSLGWSAPGKRSCMCLWVPGDNPLAPRYAALCWSNPKPSEWISHTPQPPPQFFPEGETNNSPTGSTRATWGNFHKINPQQGRMRRHPPPHSLGGGTEDSVNSIQAQVRVCVSGAGSQMNQGCCSSKTQHSVASIH